jgi:hypothetical protein
MTLSSCIRVRRSAVFAVCATLLLQGAARCQFSPGELSRAHQELEGSQNCTRCHEVGREISGEKCLNCHGEIRTRVEAKQGYHAQVAAKKCVDCHKEHLGKTARTTLFDGMSFDHIQTGFPLNGKHAGISCDKCHNQERITDPAVRKTLDVFPRTTYLGLLPACAGCHRDPHRGKFKGGCSSCHSSAGWASVARFDHAVTRFPLEGKHAPLACEKCHTAIGAASGASEDKFATKGFADCSPCHTSPHTSTLGGSACKSCHTPEGWRGALSASFNHSWTSYSLTGRHAALRCEQCHRPGEGRDYRARFLIPCKKCTDCHTDRHNGEFLQTYQNNCSTCHTDGGYVPSTFTIARHDQTRFPLNGSHRAVDCRKCHEDNRTRALTFRSSSLRCESCHKDIHQGIFTALMKEKSCGACHTSDSWKQTVFDHASTKFPLVGKHADLPCMRCHNEAPRFAALPAACESCHKDMHQGQFMAVGRTDCGRCHMPEGWKSLVFDHGTQSSFPLTGAHIKARCSRCHPQERSDTTVFVRYKPLSATCESCHKRRNGQQ